MPRILGRLTPRSTSSKSPSSFPALNRLACTLKVLKGSTDRIHKAITIWQVSSQSMIGWEHVGGDCCTDDEILSCFIFFGSQISLGGLTDTKHLNWQSRAPHVAVEVRSLGHLACLQNSACGKFLIKISSAIIGLRCALLVHAVLTCRCIESPTGSSLKNAPC